MNDPHDVALMAQFGHLVPEMLLALFACVLFIGGAFTRPAHRYGWQIVAMVGLVLALLTLLILPRSPIDASIPFAFDSLAMFTRVVAILGTMLLVALSWNELPEQQVSDYLGCLLVIALGTGLVGSANDLVGMFIALELVSIPTYVLLYLPRYDEPSQEAAMKYFLLSVLSSALLLFGFSYLYGLGGTTNISGILDALARAQQAGGQAEQFSSYANASGVALIALILVVAGLGFRITAVPFHFYAPDVYQGTSPGAAAMLALIPKVAGFAALLRVLGFVVPEGIAAGTALGLALSRQVPVLLWFLALITMTLGNLLALLQDNLRRLLAYSGVAHAGYMLVALASAPYLESGSAGVAALLYYLVAYGTMTTGVFLVITMLHRPDRPVENVDDLAGLSRSHPRVAFMTTVLLFSMIGIPLTAGFTGKLIIFFGALSVSGESATIYRVLALAGMLTAAVSGWYYLRIIAAMYLRPAVRPIAVPGSIAGISGLVVCTVLTVGLSIPPGANWLLKATRSATASAIVAHAPARE